jgi:hypothetical protein
MTTNNTLQNLDDIKKDMAEVRGGMMTVFRDMRDGNTTRKDADAMANAAGKVIGAAKTELASIALSKAFEENQRPVKDVPTLPA